MTKDQIKNGFWYYRPKESFPPKCVMFPEHHKSKNNRLNLACTQTNLGSYKQKKLVRQWCELLPNLKLKYLWFSSRVNQELFEAACIIKGLEGLYIKWSGIKKLDSINKLTNLRYLHIGPSVQIESIDCLSELKQLVIFEIENFKKINNLAPIGEMSNLAGLNISGSMETTQYVDSLEPLVKLKKLEYLFLANLKARDKNLRVLSTIKTLQNLTAALWWSSEDFEFLKNSLPNLKYGTPLDYKETLKLLDGWKEKTRNSHLF